MVVLYCSVCCAGGWRGCYTWVVWFECFAVLCVVGLLFEVVWVVACWVYLRLFGYECGFVLDIVVLLLVLVVALIVIGLDLVFG